MTTPANTKALFELGTVTSTPGAQRALSSIVEAYELLDKHRILEKGLLGEYDHNLNKEAVAKGERILSSYMTKKGMVVWIITEADRSVTTVLLPAEY